MSNPYHVITMAIYTKQELKQKIIEVEKAISDALHVEEHSLDTGQSKQRVKKQQLSELRAERDALMARYEALCCGNITYLRPGW